MTRRALIGAVMLAAAPALAHPPTVLSPQGNAAIIAEIEAFYTTLLAAVAAKDVVKLREMYADSFTHTHTSARTDGKDARLVSLLAGEAAVENMQPAERAITIHAGGWAAVARGLTPIRANDGKTYMVHWAQFLTRSDNDRWQLAASQATRGREITS
jgi:ketosteroid isomerase-like protein